MKTQMKKNNFGGILVLLVFAVFTVSVLIVLLSGADIVENLTRRDQQSYGRRTTEQYITTRIHQADTAEMIRTDRFADQNALVLTEEIDGIYYDTIVYCYDGYLRELFCEQGYEQDPEFGEMILPLEHFNAEEDGAAIRISLAYSDGTDRELLFKIRSERSPEA